MTPDLEISYDDEFSRHVVEFDPDSDRSTSEIVVYAIANVTEEDPTALRPLGEVINPDALDSIFDQSGSSGLGDAHLSFKYEGYEVTIFNHGRITIAEPI